MGIFVVVSVLLHIKYLFVVCCMFFGRMSVLCCLSVEKTLFVVVLFTYCLYDVCILFLQTMTTSFVSFFLLCYCLNFHSAELLVRSCWWFDVCVLFCLFLFVEYYGNLCVCCLLFLIYRRFCPMLCFFWKMCICCCFSVLSYFCSVLCFNWKHVCLSLFSFCQSDGSLYTLQAIATLFVPLICL